MKWGTIGGFNKKRDLSRALLDESQMWLSRAPTPAAGLLASGEIAFLGTHGVAAVETVEVNGSVSAVGDKVSGRIDERILAAQFLFDIFEARGHLFDRGRKEGFAARLVGKLL